MNRRCLTVEQLLYCLDWIWSGRAAQIDAKTKFRFGNIVPKQWTFSGFVQHSSPYSMYKDDNKISQQQQVMYMNKMLGRVTHFRTNEFWRRNPTTVLMAKSPRRHRLCTHRCIHRLIVYFRYFRTNGKHESTLTTSKILMVHNRTKENWTYNLRGRNNARAVKSSTVVILDDTKCRVVSLIKRPTTITRFSLKVRINKLMLGDMISMD